jgi:polysaccharide deacetylase family protein (PEP-CTERM system associated)
MQNILSVDLEESFCAHNLESLVPREKWESQTLRIEANAGKLLDLFDAFKVEATFFVLGWIAERLPHLVKEIAARGHEIATHGYGHSLLTGQSPAEFEADLKHALAVTAPLSPSPIRGYRAPSFTVTPKTTWAYPILERNGIAYDSSVFPIKGHPDYGFPGVALLPYPVSPRLTEFPLSCVTVGNLKIPASGGAYFRLLPWFMSRLLFKRCLKQGRCVVFYLHPWEIDAGQPRYPLPRMRRWRQYCNIGVTEQKVRRMLGEFSFTSFRKALSP